MFRNQPKHRSNRALIFSPQSSNRVQCSQIEPKFNQHIEFVPIQKTRTFSHKKLTLTSALPPPLSNISNESVKKPSQPTFEASKFYRPPTKGSTLLQSKKTNIEDNKISLRVSTTQNFQIPSPERSNQISRIQTQIQNDKQNSMKHEISVLIQSKFQTFLYEINNQSAQINELKRKIHNLENQINLKTQIINNLMNQKLYRSEISYNDRKDQLINKIKDLEGAIQSINWQSNRAQNNINIKIDQLTNKLVRLEFIKSEEQNNILKIRIDQLKSKLSSWMNDKETKILIFGEKLNKFQEIFQTFRFLSCKIQKLQEQLSNKRIETEKIIQTKDSINYWDSFQDFVISNSSRLHLENNSIFGSDDYFFHPDSNTSIMRLKSSLLCNKMRLSSTKDSSMQVIQINQNEQRDNSFNNVVTLMQELKSKFSSQLPLSCKIDKHRRLLIKETNKLLKNQKDNNYYKVNDEQARILQQRAYIRLEQ